MNRREFLAQTGAAASGVLAGTATGAAQSVCIVRDPADPVASAAPVGWAFGQLQEALAARGVAVRLLDRLEQAPAGALCIVAAGPSAPISREVLSRGGATLPASPEALALARGRAGTRSVLLAAGHDARGLVYALLELADRIEYSPEPAAALEIPRPVVERPANPVRSIARLFSSEVEDKPWFYDREFWKRYLSLLAAQRFNRFSLTLGLGYDFLREVTDAYLHFAYPFLLDVPGYRVRAVGLPDAERDRNLETLRFIGDETTARGLHFQLGLWTHGYDWASNPGVNYVIGGLSPENHAAYCRDALRLLLQTCPAIAGVTFRIHGESGVAEGSYAFWKTVFEGVAQCGRRVEIDLHTKGIDQAMIDTALATGMPVTLSPKFWAEHLGLPYQQASIRALEMPPRDRNDEGFFAKSSGSRQFLRYGYGDLLSEDRLYGVFYRVWPGTQRLLLWGDPAFAAGYGRAAGFCGSLGMEFCEPLSFKGRKGSGLPGGRDAYADPALKPPDGDFAKYLYTYRLWGRSLYNPSADPEGGRRFLRRQYGPAAAATEAALAHASRILPLVTTAHLPSAANNGFWPEIYTNMPIVDEKRPHPYSDTPAPKRFGAVSPLDPELFSRIDDFAEDLLSGESGGKYSPIEVAQWLEDLSLQAARHLSEADGLVADRHALTFRRLAVDVSLQSGLGRFFAAKLRAGVLYALYERTGSREAIQQAQKCYRAARAAWAALGQETQGVYVADITFGRAEHLRGHWADRLTAIDQDLSDMERRAPQPNTTSAHRDPARTERAIRAALSRPARPRLRIDHASPAPFRRGQPVPIEIALREGAGHSPAVSIQLRYRRVNQIEPYRAEPMQARGRAYRATIPGDYTDSPFPLQYYFLVQDTNGRAWLLPGFDASLANQPYYVVRQQAGG